MKKLIKKIRISVPMKIITGIRIGDSKDNVQIGGVDNPIVRRRDNNQPYIPGSSLKGKIRCLLELAKGENADSNSQMRINSLICQLFGAGDNEEELRKIKKRREKNEITDDQAKAESEKWEGGKSRLIVRDSYLSKKSVQELLNSEFTDMPYTEIKWENVIHRIKGVAEHPRQMERVPPGAEFEVNMVINIFDGDDVETLFGQLKKGMELLEADYLGGSGSRGYGQIEWGNIETTEINTADYLL